MHYLENLNPTQKDAVTSKNQYNRIIAGAGSGKTRVLTTRIAYLIDKVGVNPRNILALTFTNKAAKEMKNRLEKMIDFQSNTLRICTFHSLCVRILREDIEVLGKYTKNFIILDDDDQNKIVKDIYKNLKKDGVDFDYDFSKFDRSYLKQICYWKSNLYSADEILEESEEDFTKICAIMYQKYVDYLENNNYLDFDDLLIKTLKIFQGNATVLEKWQKRFSHILVDEFQDSDNIQYELINLMATELTEIYIVGDPDQTIYTWRGAKVDYILNFDKIYSNVKTILLEENYRSSKNILKCANNLIKYNYERIDKNLFTENSDGDEVFYYMADDPAQEADNISIKINELVSSGQYCLNDIAILYRSNYLTKDLERILTRNAIKFKIYGGIQFYKREEIKTTINYLRLLFNNNDEVAFDYIINRPRRGIGEVGLEKLLSGAKSVQLGILSYLESYFNQIDLSSKIKAELVILINAIKTAQNLLKNAHSLNYSTIVYKYLQDLKYIGDLEEKKEFDRIDNIKELMNDINHYFSSNQGSTFESYIQEVSIASSQDEIVESEFVTLMTVHTAKGLEYKVVFIYGLNEGVFPSIRSLEEDNIEEERRIAYVAITRAEEKLFLSGNRSFSVISGKGKTPSRFVDEIFSSRTVKVKSAIPVPFKKIDTISKNNIKWKTGDNLFSDVFGEGTIIEVSSSNIITVAFKDFTVGKKILDGSHHSLSLAKGKNV